MIESISAKNPLPSTSQKIQDELKNYSLEEPYFVWNILLVSFLDHRIFIKYIANQLRRYPNLDFATIDSLRARVYDLTRLSLFLAFRRSLGKKQMLSVTRSSEKNSGTRQETKIYLATLPELCLGNLSGDDELLVQRGQVGIAQ